MTEADFQFENENQASRYLGETVSAAFKTLLETMQPGCSIDLILKQLKSKAGNDQLRKADADALHSS